MILQARKHLQGLQAVNTQLFEKIVFWRERARRQLKMLGRQIEHLDRKSTRLNSSHVASSYAVFCLKKKTLVTAGSRFVARGDEHRSEQRRQPRLKRGNCRP